MVDIGLRTKSWQILSSGVAQIRENEQICGEGSMEVVGRQ